MECKTCKEEIYYNPLTKSWEMHIQTWEWDTYYDGFVYLDIPISFCYECGKDYRNIKYD